MLPGKQMHFILYVEISSPRPCMYRRICSRRRREELIRDCAYVGIARPPSGLKAKHVFFYKGVCVGMYNAGMHPMMHTAAVCCGTNSNYAHDYAILLRFGA